MTDETNTGANDAAEPIREAVDAAPRTRQARAPRETVDAEDETTERRRKRPEGNSDDPTLRRFGLLSSQIDNDKFVYRAVPDEGVRLAQLTEQDDYDFFTAAGSKATDGDGKGVLRYRSGTKLDGAPQYTYLLRKLKKYADEDRKAKVQKIDEAEKARLSKTPGDAPDNSYTPKR